MVLLESPVDVVRLLFIGVGLYFVDI